MSSPTPSRFDHQHAASYDERWAPLAPMRDSLHLQISLILRDLPSDARVLCIGVGTGAELLALAARFPSWSFIAADPSVPMLEVCRRRATDVGIAKRCEFHAAYVHELPSAVAECDAATAILVSQFITERSQRIAFFREIARRLRPQGMLVCADLGVSPAGQHEALLTVWQNMMRHVGASEEQIQATLNAYGSEVALLNDSEMEALLAESGFPASVHFSQSLLIHARFARLRG